jgi:ferredoxin
MTTRLHIDWTACDGRGLCTELLPELLGRDEWGYPVPRDGAAEPGIPADLAGHARRAVAACPRLALALRADARPVHSERRRSAQEASAP